MAYRRRFGRRRFGGLHGQIRHRPSRRGFAAARAARRTYRRSIRMPKRLLAKTYANTVGQIAYREYPRRRPMHGGYRRRFR